jgi:hypothetical protein
MVALQNEIMEHPAPSVGMLVWLVDEYDNGEPAQYEHVICGSQFKDWMVGIEIIGYCDNQGDWNFPDDVELADGTGMDATMRELLAGVVALGNGVWSHPLLTEGMDLPDGALPWNEKYTPEAIVETHDGYWDCECRTHYIYQKCIEHCGQCGATSEQMPDSRRVEMENPKNWASPLAYQQWRAENFHNVRDARIAAADEDERLLGYDQHTTTGSMEGR